jgi:carbamoyltransferase
MNKILSIHLGHDGALTYVENNEIIFHTSIDRYLRLKHTYFFSLELLEIISNLDFDTLIITNLSHINIGVEIFSGLSVDYAPLRNKLSKVNIIFNGDKNHHYTHVACLKTMTENLEQAVVIDGSGSLHENILIHHTNSPFPSKGELWEQESFFLIENNSIIHKIIEEKNIGKAYEKRAQKIFGPGQKESKLMSLYQYGDFNLKYYNTDELIDENKNPYRIYNEVTFKDKEIFDMAYTTQKITEDLVIDFFKKTSSSKIGYTGGVAQNVILNAKLKNKYKNLIIDPMCGDMGISLGSANIATNFKLKRKTIYLGIPQKLDLTNCPFSNDIVSYTEVVKILNNDPVGIFQSRSEQGQRGLGNRSLLMNADHKNCREKINKIKKREWFRPFALSILEEDVEEYFENAFPSPYMMYIFKLKLKYRNKLKDGVAIDYTSRIQTVNKKDNFHFYNLLKEFREIYNIPYLLNTSLNMPGHVLVEKLEDLYKMMYETDLKYAYLPEKQILIKK